MRIESKKWKIYHGEELKKSLHEKNDKKCNYYGSYVLFNIHTKKNDRFTGENNSSKMDMSNWNTHDATNGLSACTMIFW